MKKFLKYVVPSVLAFALSGIYAIVDGFFVGNSVGDVGLSAINVVYPVVTLMQSAGTGIGMGGAGSFVDNGNGELEFSSDDGSVKGIIQINGWDGASFEVTETSNPDAFPVGQKTEFPFAF